MDDLSRTIALLGEGFQESGNESNSCIAIQKICEAIDTRHLHFHLWEGIQAIQYCIGNKSAPPNIFTRSKFMH